MKRRRTRRRFSPGEIGSGPISASAALRGLVGRACYAAAVEPVCRRLIAEPLAGRQERALPCALVRPNMQPGARHRQLQGAKGGDQLAWPAAVAVPLGGLTALVAAAAKRRLELFLQRFPR